MEDFGGMGGGGGGSGQAAASSASSTSGNNFGGGAVFTPDGGLTPLAGVILGVAALLAFISLIAVARR